jgi:hypothetical protein
MSEPSESLAIIASRYMTKITVFPTSAVAIQRVLAANPDRWYVRFDSDQFSGFANGLFPGPPTTPPAGVSKEQPPLEYKFRDCPSIVTGEFYLYGGAGGTNIYIFECIYQG